MIIPCTIVSVTVLPIPFFLHSFLEAGVTRLILVLITNTIASFAFIYFVGLTHSERLLTKEIITKILKESREYIYCRLSPYKNKGEEALLRGIESLYKEKYKEDINFFVFGQSDEIEHDGNITSFPVKWCYPTYKYPKKFAGRVGFIKRLLCSLTYQIGLSPYVSEVEKHSEVMSALQSRQNTLGPRWLL